MYKIMIVEDDATLASLIGEELNKWGMVPQRAEQFRDIVSDYLRFDPQLIIMDITLPYYDGFYWCEQIRKLTKIPIIFLSSRSEDADKLRAMYGGGDDYVEKPFSMDVLIAKIKALLRRVYDYNDTTNHLISYGEIILDLERAVLSYQNNEVILTQNECQIMGLLMKEAEKTVSRTKIMKTLWRDECFIDENTLTVNMTRLRGKLKEIGLEQCIHTVKGKGYRIEQ